MLPVNVCLGMNRDASLRMKCSASVWLAILSGRNQDGRATSMNERYIKWWTPYLSREFEMLAFETAEVFR
jgi:hypothetical protein